ncbi:MAG: hypothetical protein K6T90_06725 [Leptolyngbyaceae cyanobacterium HOT.MB2.61]|nr:hypothetical protein [Leptolyngbyaceae cyanobacterium HOT.MB2.61]
MSFEFLHSELPVACCHHREARAIEGAAGRFQLLGARCLVPPPPVYLFPAASPKAQYSSLFTIPVI